MIMIKFRILIFAIVVLAMGGILVSLNGCGGGSSGGSPTPPSSGKIQHVVVIFQRTAPRIIFSKTKR